MKQLGIYCATLVALVGAGVAYSAASPSAKLAKQDRVYGGGQFGPGCFPTICFANPRNLAVDAHAESDGTDASGDSTYGTPGAAESVRSVSCLRVEGNAAVIGGVIESGPNADYGFVQYFLDRGGPGLGSRDLASASLVDPLDAPGWPAGFPVTCPSPTVGWPAAGPPDYLELDEGDIVVKDAPTD